MENMNYEIKHIDKLEDLKDFEWEYKGLKLRFNRFCREDGTIRLDSKNFINHLGKNNI